MPGKTLANFEVRQGFALRFVVWLFGAQQVHPLEGGHQHGELVDEHAAGHVYLAEEDAGQQPTHAQEGDGHVLASL